MASELITKPPLQDDSIAVESKHKPRVKEIPWYLSILGCSLCSNLHKSIYDLLMTNVRTTKAEKGAIGFYCFWFHNAHSCHSFVQTYFELIAMDLWNGVLSSSFLCSEVFRVCESSYE